MKDLKFFAMSRTQTMFKLSAFRCYEKTNCTLMPQSLCLQARPKMTSRPSVSYFRNDTRKGISSIPVDSQFSLMKGSKQSTSRNTSWCWHLPLIRNLRRLTAYLKEIRISLTPWIPLTTELRLHRIRAHMISNYVTWLSRLLEWRRDRLFR